MISIPPGYRIVSDVYVTDTNWVRRTWKERLFTRPWTPFVKYKSVYDAKVLLVNNEFGKLAIVSPQTYSKLEKQNEQYK